MFFWNSLVFSVILRDNINRCWLENIWSSWKQSVWPEFLVCYYVLGGGGGGRESWYLVFPLREVVIKSLYPPSLPIRSSQPLSSQINETLPGFGKRSFKHTFNFTLSIIHLLKKCSPLEPDCIIDLKIVVRSSITKLPMGSGELGGEHPFSNK